MRPIVLALLVTACSPQDLGQTEQALVGTSTTPWSWEQYPREGWFDWAWPDGSFAGLACNAAFVAVRPDGRYGVALTDRHCGVMPAGRWWWSWPYAAEDPAFPGDIFRLGVLGDSVHRVVDRRNSPTDGDLAVFAFRTDPAWLAAHPEGFPQALRTPTTFPDFAPEVQAVMVSAGDSWHDGAMRGSDPSHARKVGARLLDRPTLPPAFQDQHGFAASHDTRTWLPVDEDGKTIDCDFAVWYSYFFLGGEIDPATEPACVIFGDSGAGLWNPSGTALYALNRGLSWQDRSLEYGLSSDVQYMLNPIGHFAVNRPWLRHYIETWTGAGALQVQQVARASASTRLPAELALFSVDPSGGRSRLLTIPRGATEGTGGLAGERPAGSLLAVVNGSLAAPLHVYVDYRGADGQPAGVRVSLPSFTATQPAYFWVDGLGSTYWADAQHDGIRDVGSELLAPLAAIPDHLDEAHGSRAQTQAELRGVVSDGGNVEVAAFVAGTVVTADTPPVAVTITRDGGRYVLSLPTEVGYGTIDLTRHMIVEGAETYDVYVRRRGERARTLAAERVIAGVHANVDLKIGRSTIFYFPRYLVLGPYRNPAGCAPAPDVATADRICDGAVDDGSIQPAVGLALGPPSPDCAAPGSAYAGEGPPTVTLFETTKTTLDFNHAFFGLRADPVSNLSGWAWIYVENRAQVAREYVLALASDDAARVTVNHEDVAYLGFCRGLDQLDSLQNRRRVTLQPGQNLIGWEVFEGGGGWGLRARLEHPDGRPLTTDEIRLSWAPAP
jgi:hypothetical protein